jgi:hypothetical protein
MKPCTCGKVYSEKYEIWVTPEVKETIEKFWYHGELDFSNENMVIRTNYPSLILPKSKCKITKS